MIIEEMQSLPSILIIPVRPPDAAAAARRAETPRLLPFQTITKLIHTLGEDVRKRPVASRVFISVNQSDNVVLWKLRRDDRPKHKRLVCKLINTLRVIFRHFSLLLSRKLIFRAFFITVHKRKALRLVGPPPMNNSETGAPKTNTPFAFPFV